MVPRVMVLVDYMTPLVHVLEPDAKLAEAKALMEQHGVRHLPVIEGERVLGMVTMSDVFVLEHTLGTDDEATMVKEVMTKDLYQAEGNTPLGEVARAMVERRIGSAIVLHDGKPAGVFTTTDALRALGDALA